MGDIYSGDDQLLHHDRVETQIVEDYWEVINSHYDDAIDRAIRAQLSASRPHVEVFNNHAHNNPYINIGLIDRRLDVLDRILEHNPTDSKINRLVANGILRDLHGMRHNETLFALESTNAILGLQDRGLDIHASILASYTVGEISYKEARLELRSIRGSVVIDYGNPYHNSYQGHYSYNHDSHHHNDHHHDDNYLYYSDDMYNYNIKSPSKIVERVELLIDPQIGVALDAIKANITDDYIDEALRRQGIDPSSLTDRDRHLYIDAAKRAVDQASKDANYKIEKALSSSNFDIDVDQAAEISGIDVDKLVEEALVKEFKRAIDSGIPLDVMQDICDNFKSSEPTSYKGLDCAILNGDFKP